METLTDSGNGSWQYIAKITVQICKMQNGTGCLEEVAFVLIPNCIYRCHIIYPLSSDNHPSSHLYGWTGVGAWDASASKDCNISWGASKFIFLRNTLLKILSNTLLSGKSER